MIFACPFGYTVKFVWVWFSERYENFTPSLHPVEFDDIFSLNVSKCSPDVSALGRAAERKSYPTDVHSPLFVQIFVACVACVVDPVLLIRLLAHRLVTTPLYPRNSSSITSMSGQDQFPPRTCRSRASSTDTNASTRRKRVRRENAS